EIDGEGVEQRRRRIFVGEEELAEDETGHGAVEQEIVPLDGRADRGGDDGAAELARVSLRRQCGTGIDGCSHRPLSLSRPAAGARFFSSAAGAAFIAGSRMHRFREDGKQRAGAAEPAPGFLLAWNPLPRLPSESGEPGQAIERWGSGFPLSRERRLWG